MNIAELPLSIKTIHALQGKYKSVKGSYALLSSLEEPQVSEIKTVEGLLQYTENQLLRRPGLGRKRLNEVKEWLEKQDLSLTEPLPGQKTFRQVCREAFDEVLKVDTGESLIERFRRWPSLTRTFLALANHDKLHKKGISLLDTGIWEACFPRKKQYLRGSTKRRWIS